MSIYEIVTQRVIEAIEKGGVLPWRKPWQTFQGTSAFPKNLITGKDYRGINVMLLAMQGYSSPYWLTFKQAQGLGGSVKKGEKATPVVYWSIIEKESKESGKKERLFLARYYSVFNVGQCENVQCPVHEVMVPTEQQKIEGCETLLNGYKDKPVIQEKEQRAYYSPSQDLINMPVRASFESSEEYFSTLAHELIHSVGHSSRLNRKGLASPSFFGSHEYSKEELIAEIGACFLNSHTGISSVTEQNSVAYLNGWISALKGNSKLIIEAAGQAQKSVDYILGNTTHGESEDQ